MRNVIKMLLLLKTDWKLKVRRQLQLLKITTQKLLMLRR